MSRAEPREVPSERQTRILSSALEEFAEYGYEAASTNRIARRARVSKGLIFRYFSSKEQLFESVLAGACERLFTAGPGPLPPDPFERLEAFLLERASRLAAHPADARLVAQFRGPTSWLLTPAARRIEKAHERLRAHFRAGVDTRTFRSGVDPEAALDLLELLAEGFERKLLGVFLDASPQAAQAQEASNLVPHPALQPEAVLGRVRAYISMLRKGIYRPGAVRARKASIDPEAFLAWSSRFVLSRGGTGRPDGGKGPSSDSGDRAQGSRDQKRDRILRAAQELFAERGYDGTSAEAVARQAGVAKGLIFHHFGSKARLYLAAVADATTRISKAFFEAEAPPTSDLLDRLSSWARRKMLLFQQQPVYSKLVVGALADPPEAVREELRAYVMEGIQAGWSLILEGIDPAPFRPEVELAQAVELVVTVLDAVGDRGLVRMASEGERGLELFPRLVEELEVYLELLKDGLCTG